MHPYAAEIVLEKGLNFYELGFLHLVELLHQSALTTRSIALVNDTPRSRLVKLANCKHHGCS